MKRKKPFEKFHHEEKVTIGKGKNKKVIRKLFVVDKKGNIREHSRINATEPIPLMRFKAKDESEVKMGVSIIGQLEEADAVRQIIKKKARGIQIRVTASAREWVGKRKKRYVKKEHSFSSRVAFDKHLLKNPKYVTGLVAGRLQNHLRKKGFRLSHRSISTAKTAKMLKGVTFSIHIFY